ncbi:hypothetical protein BOTBODRAFT_43425 [Botryobasidium botryosum FD-172 SS1]|uniref:Uncharacterized protein n=1 Tax=Botryobasidium botryosum (strain FD-172 SS1) TaxID=930990 RepID=A0A067MY60_BOTB1|nr:hypothetical protein BOTBODRAFT_43425 [Botryobasidium botryosum FD-172 SS1]
MASRGAAWQAESAKRREGMPHGQQRVPEGERRGAAWLAKGARRRERGAAWLARGDAIVIMATASSAAWQAVYVIVKVMPHGQQKLRDGAYKCRRLVSNSF